MKKTVSLLKSIVIAAFFFFSGCNYSTHSFNNGKLLDPGETMTTCSAGMRGFYKLTGDTLYPGYYDRSGWVMDTLIIPPDTNLFYHWSAAFDFRLGVLSRRPFGKGLEIGLLIETPVQYARNIGMVPLLQFDGRFGLPRCSLANSAYSHDLSIGWIMGQWVDNSWFIEYAGGLEYRTCTPYFNVRMTRVGTDANAAGKTFGDTDFLTYKRNGWNARACTGLSFKLPAMPVLPDFIVPEIALFYPSGMLKVPGLSWHIGFRWLDDK
jgi:hypothetical protein